MNTSPNKNIQTNPTTSNHPNPNSTHTQNDNHHQNPISTKTEQKKHQSPNKTEPVSNQTSSGLNQNLKAETIHPIPVSSEHSDKNSSVPNISELNSANSNYLLK